MLLQNLFCFERERYYEGKCTGKINAQRGYGYFRHAGVFTRNIAVTSGELALYRAVLASVLIGFYLVFIKKGGLNLKKRRA